MSRRLKIIIAAIVVLLVLIGIFTILLARQRTNAPVPTSDNTPAPALPAPIAPLPTPVIIQPAPPGPHAQNPEVVAADFTERYGSFSNQNNYANLRDLSPQMTTTMRARTEAFIASNPQKTAPYAGTTTNVARTEIVSQTEATMIVKLYSQQITSGAGQAEAITYPTATVTLTKDGLRWLVDSFEWGS